MISVLAVVYIFVCLFFILLVLIQDPKGGGAGMFGGSGSNSILGTSGNDFMTKLTKYTAIVFGCMAIALTILTKGPKTGVFDKIPGIAAEAPAPQKTEAPAEAPPEATAPAENPTAPAETAPKAQ